MTLTTDYTLKEVADSLGMSESWLRKRVQAGAEHQRYGHKIMFSPEQVEQLRAAFTKTETPQAITTGRKKRSA